MSLRIALSIADADARLILGDNNAAAASLEKSGEAVYNDAGGDATRNVMLRVAMLEPEERRQRIAQIRQLGKAGAARSWAPYVFSSSAPARLRENVDLGKSLASDSGYGIDGARLWLGEPIEIGPHLAATLARMPRENLLIAGQDERLAHAILCSALIGACADGGVDELDLAIVQASTGGHAWSKIFDELGQTVPHEVATLPMSGVGDLFGDLAEVVASRRTGAAGRSKIVVIPGLDRLDALRETDRFGKAAGAAAAFLDVVNDGPGVGVHIFAWSAVFTNLERLVQRQATLAFGLRVALPMPDSESNAYLQIPAAGRLGAERALFKDDVRAHRPVKFKPYELPDSETWARIATRLRGRRQPDAVDNRQAATEREVT